MMLLKLLTRVCWVAVVCLAGCPEEGYYRDYLPPETVYEAIDGDDLNTVHQEWLAQALPWSANACHVTLPEVWRMSRANLRLLCTDNENVVGCFAPYSRVLGVDFPTSIWIPLDVDEDEYHHLMKHELIHWFEYCHLESGTTDHTAPGVWCESSECVLGRALGRHK